MPFATPGTRFSAAIGKGSNVKMGTISQENSMTINAIASLSAQDATTVATKIANTATQVAKDAQNSTNGFGATPQGQKSLSAAATKMSNTSMQNSMTNAAADVITKMKQGNTITFTIADGATVDIGNMTQSNIISLVAQNMLSSAFTAAGTSDIVTKLSQTSDNSQTAVNAGQPDATKSSSSSMIILMILGVVVVGGLAYYLWFKQNPWMLPICLSLLSVK